MATNRKQSYVEGAFIMMFGGLLVKVIGALFKIPLTNLIGGQGMSYFSVAYDIYTWMYIVTTAGLPVAISRMVSESNARGRYEESRRIHRVAFSGFMVLGTVGSLFLFFGAEWLAVTIGNPNSELAIRAIAPAIMFEIVMSSNRGYFQGNKNMIPTVVSQLIVAMSKLVIGSGLAWYLSESGQPMTVVAAGAILGVTIGGGLGAAYLSLTRRRFNPLSGQTFIVDESDPMRVLLKRLVAIAIPITIGSSVLSVTNLVDTGIVMRRLTGGAGIALAGAEMLYGSYSNLARTVFNLPSSIIVPLGTSVIPVISEKFSLGKRGEARDIAKSALRLATLLALPAGFGISFMSGPILSLLFGSRPEEVAIAAPLLAQLGPAVLFVCLVSITNSILQAMGHERVPVVTMLFGGILKLVSNYILVGTPSINIAGAPVGTTICYGTITLLNMIILRRELGGLDIIKSIIRPAMASFVACGAAYLAYGPASGILGASLATVACIGLAALLYGMLIIVTRTLAREDVRMLPKGDAIERILDRFSLLR